MGPTPHCYLWKRVPERHLGISCSNFDSQFVVVLLESLRAKYSKFAPRYRHLAIHSPVWLLLYEHQ